MRPLVIFKSVYSVQGEQHQKIFHNPLNNNNNNKTDMATSDRLDISVGDSLKGVKGVMSNLSQRVKETNARSKCMEEESAAVKKKYIKSYGQQQALKERKEMMEERLEKNEEKIKNLTKRYNEKQKFCEESKKFTSSLKVTVADESEVFEMEERLRMLKEIYARNYESYQISRSKKVKLEQEFEHVELKAHEARRRMESLNTELEYTQTEEARREEACKAAIDGAFRTEKTCVELQKGMDVIMQRKEGYMRKINKLEREVHKAESTIDTYKFERRRMEATIREYLLTIRNQQQQS